MRLWRKRTPLTERERRARRLANMRGPFGPGQIIVDPDRRPRVFPAGYVPKPPPRGSVPEDQP